VAACRGVYQLADFGDARDVGALLEADIARAGAPPVLGKTKRFAERGFDRREPAAKGRLLLAGEALGIDAATGEGIAQALAMGAHAGAFAGHVLGGRVAPERWTLALQSTWVALDLRLRARAARAVFDPRRRAALEPLLVDADIADVATRLFAGHRPSAGAVLRSVRRIARSRSRE
ncbi:MAG TPA: hypothetical protein VL400_19205, partial [Polyangiaceae bacterium]|nr:hypothetical protein [Polyangiaceae bacterium]